MSKLELESATRSFADDMSDLLKEKFRQSVDEALQQQLKLNPSSTSRIIDIPITPTKNDRWSAVLPNGQEIVRTRRRDVVRVLRGKGFAA